MKHITTFLLLLLTATIYAQTSEKQEVQTTIQDFFKAFHNQDSTAIKQHVREGMILQTISANREGKVDVKTERLSNFLKSIASIPENVKFEEKLLSFNIQVDGAMANAWTEYEFWVNGNFSHCGVNSFQLFKDNGKWKVIYLVDTRRREGCKN
jgi:ketosteroid isomerase-like protein